MSLRIVVLEDDLHDFELMQTALEADGLRAELVLVGDPTELQKALQRAHCDVVLVDYWLPRGDGLAALRLCHENHPDLPVIVVSGVLGEEQVVDTLKLGATDYVLKSHMARLAPAIRRALREVAERDARRRAEEARERFFTLSTDLFAIANFEGLFVDVNEGWERVLGWTRADLVGRSYLEFVHADDREVTKAGHERVFAGEPLGPFENRYRAGDGSWRWLQWNACIDRGAKLAYAVARDVTPWKLVQQELVTQAARQAAIASFGGRALRAGSLPALFDDAAHLIAQTLDVEFVGLAEREADADRLQLIGRFGWPAEVLLKQGIPIQPRSHAGFTLLQNSPVRIDDWETETRFDMAPALRDLRVKSALCVPIAGHGKAFGVIGVHTRASRKFSDDDSNFLTSMANVLAEAVERQHSELQLARSQDQLRQAQKMEAVGQLASGVAHDFNNVLTAILGYSELAQEGLEPGSDLCRQIAEIHRAALHAADLTRKLLAFSRKQVLAPRVIDLNREIAEMRALLGRLIGEDVELTLSLATDLAPIEVDPVQIEQVLVNLIVNARDALPHGGRIEIETRNVAESPGTAGGNTSWVALEIRDHGSGIDSSVLPRIFEPFFTTKAPGKGTGMGLATVQGIVEQSRGLIEVKSELGQGTSFTLLFPRSREPLSALPKQARAERAHATGETVLIVEDDAAIRELMRRVLAGDGYTALVAGDGRQALELVNARDKPLDLIVADLVMPHMSGYALRDELALTPKAPRWLFVSGFASHALVEQRLREANVAFLPKPFSPEQLLRSVREALDAVLA